MPTIPHSISFRDDEANGKYMNSISMHSKIEMAKRIRHRLILNGRLSSGSFLRSTKNASVTRVYVTTTAKLPAFDSHTVMLRPKNAANEVIAQIKSTALYGVPYFGCIAASDLGSIPLSAIE